MKYLFYIFSFFISTLSWAQTIDFSAHVDLSYDAQPLGEVLEDITSRYDLKFSYSNDVVPIEQLMYAQMEQIPLRAALDSLFAQTQVIYGFIGHQIVLSVDHGRVPRSTVPAIGMEIEEDAFDSIASNDTHTISHQEARTLYQIPRLERKKLRGMPVVQKREPQFSATYVQDDLDEKLNTGRRRTFDTRAQVTIIPPLTFATNDEDENPVAASLNVFYGSNQQLEGVELGGLGNSIKKDAEGFQAAGIFNVVNGNLSGMQAAGLFNFVGQYANGLQFAGFGNYAADGKYLVQIGGVANVAQGNILGQIGGIANVARDIELSQVGGILNLAHTVKGAQIGLFNFSDSTSVAIGLLSYVNKGYRCLEISGEDVIYGNVNLRMGTRSFYNIFHFGVKDASAPTWTLGYGIGSSIRIGKSNFSQIELLARHVNEDDLWTNELNLLNQLKINFDFALGKNFSFAVGPSLNVAVSKLYNSETQKYGTAIPHYTFFDETDFRGGDKDPVNVKGWLGFQIGLRWKSRDYWN